MTLEQFILVGVLIAMFGVFALDRFRIEVVALAGLVVAFAAGLVPGAAVFSGMSHPAVITVAEILILVGALRASHVLDQFAAILTRRVSSETTLLFLLCTVGAFVSVFMNNIGALALMIPVATAVAAKTGTPVSRLLMPISFATLLGGTCSLIGTPANLIVSDILRAETGRSMGFFEFAKVGLPALLAGVVAIVLFVPRLLPASKSPLESEAVEPAGESGRMILEARVPPRSSLAGLFVPAAEAQLDGRIESIHRGDAFVFGRRESIRLEPGDDLLVEGKKTTLEKLVALGLIRPGSTKGNPGEVSMSAVIVPESVVLGSRISALEGFSELGVRVTAISSPRKRLEGRFADIQLAVGDVIHLAGPERAIDAAVREHGLLNVGASSEAFSLKASLPTLLAFLSAVGLAATGLLRPEFAFGAVIVALMIFGQLDLIASVRRLNWPILIMLAAMIPLGNAVETTGMAELIAHSFLNAAPDAGPVFVLFTILLTAVVVTPFVNNASTAIVLAPIALEIAAAAGIAPETVLLAVAVGVSIDFVTPFGHHNNTIVMGVGGYRFRDFPIAGFPVLLAVFVASVFALSALVT